jgi:hypothetical protein
MIEYYVWESLDARGGRMRRRSKILVSAVFVSLVLLTSFLALRLIRLIQNIEYIELNPPDEVNASKFLYHSEAWNRVFQNVSSIPEFWNATIPSRLAGKSISAIAQMYFAEVYVNNAQYAYCHISVSSLFSQALNRTFRQMGFKVCPVVFAHAS